MTNSLCERKDLSDITEKMWGYPAYLKIEEGKEPSICSRDDKNGQLPICCSLVITDNRETPMLLRNQENHCKLNMQ